MLVVPLALFAVVRVIAFRKAGVFYEGGNEKMLTLCYYKGLNIHTVALYEMCIIDRHGSRRKDVQLLEMRGDEDGRDCRARTFLYELCLQQ